MTSTFSESHVEEAALAWLEGLGWFVVYGREIVPGEFSAQCDTLLPKMISGEVATGSLDN